VLIQTKIAMFVPVWFALAATTSYLLWRGSYSAKKVWIPRLVVLVAALIFGLVLWAEGPSTFVIVSGIVIGLITFLKLRALRFCPSCSATNRQLGFLRPANFCNKCGASLREGSTT
jgi:hypothetical protein